MQYRMHAVRDYMAMMIENVSIKKKKTFLKRRARLIYRLVTKSGLRVCTPGAPAISCTLVVGINRFIRRRSKMCVYRIMYNIMCACGKLPYPTNWNIGLHA